MGSLFLDSVFIIGVTRIRNAASTPPLATIVSRASELSMCSLRNPKAREQACFTTACLSAQVDTCGGNARPQQRGRCSRFHLKCLREVLTVPGEICAAREETRRSALGIVK